MKSGATETSYQYLQEHYQFPENVFVSHLPEEIKKSNHQYKILWAHHAYDQQVFHNFDHNIVDYIVSPSQWNKDQFIKARYLMHIFLKKVKFTFLTEKNIL